MRHLDRRSKFGRQYFGDYRPDRLGHDHIGLGYGGAFALTAAITAAGGLFWAFAVPPIRQIELD